MIVVDVYVKLSLYKIFIKLRCFNIKQIITLTIHEGKALQWEYGNSRTSVYLFFYFFILDPA